MPAAAAADTAAILARYPLLDRDASILDFNLRVLHWAERPDVPLLERLRYLCIVSSNLDEFFEVRAEPHLTAWRAGTDVQGGMRHLMAAAHALVERQYAIYNEVLLPAMATQRMRIVSHIDRTEAQRKWVREYFLREVKPRLALPVHDAIASPYGRPIFFNQSKNFAPKETEVRDWPEDDVVVVGGRKAPEAGCPVRQDSPKNFS